MSREVLELVAERLLPMRSFGPFRLDAANELIFLVDDADLDGVAFRKRDPRQVNAEVHMPIARRIDPRRPANFVEIYHRDISSGETANGV